MIGNLLVLKIGGHEIANPHFLNELTTTVAGLSDPVVIVHGGGKEISELQQSLGIEPRYIDGVRITDAPSLDVVTQILCGTVNKRLVRQLVIGGIDALGMCGADRGLILGRPMTHPDVDMGFTGEVVSVKASALMNLLEQGIVPVIAPICYGENSLLNINADHVAGAIASSLQAERLTFITNVAGVLSQEQVVPQMTANEARRLIADGTIYGGMIPKVSTALEAVDAGVKRAVITNLEGVRTYGGTSFIKD